VLIDDELVLRNLDYEAVSHWLVITTDAEQMSIVPAGQGAAPILTFDLTLEADQWASIVLMGDTADNTLVARLIPLVITDLLPDFARLTFLNALPQPINIQVNDQITVENMGFGEAPWGTDAPAGVFPAEILLNGTVIAETTSTPFEAGYSYLLTLREMAGSPQLYIVPFDLHGEIYLANFAPNQAPVSLSIDEVPIFTDIAYASVSAPASLVAGEYTLEFPNALLTSIKPDTNHIVIYHNNDTFVLEIENYTLLNENPALRDAENAEIWVYHGIQGQNPVDITLADGTTLIEGLEPGSQIARIDLPADSYHLKITAHEAPETVLFDLPGTLLRGGNVYLLALIGEAAGTQTTHLSAYCVRPEGC